jgi:serine/threonine protein kinase
MSLTPGTRLGPYEIVALLGAGGMGEVFRARDTRLEREVAIKVLPESLAANAQFRARFEREAKTISQLNHPNICTLYDVGEQNGVSYLVMELLQGESLADRLSRGPLPLADVLRYGTQIASALDRAHRAGITHRDLKPGNVVLTKSGAKLLDFGLAKAAASQPVVSIDGATEHKPLTQEGTILGTFQYMAPEQLEGAEVDARTDIFSFGALLYEMITGRRAFDGKTRTSVIAAIVSAQPPPISTIAPASPRSLDHIIQRCLEKDPQDRWQSAHDLSHELAWIAQFSTQTEVPASATPRKRSRERIAWILAATLALALAALCVTLIPKLRRAEVPTVLDIAPPRDARFNATGDEAGAVALSPDGLMAVYSIADVKGTRLMLRSLVSGEARILDGTEGGHFPFWSPDSKSIGFFTRGLLKRVEVSGGAPVGICISDAGRGGTWGADDMIVFTANTQTPLLKVPATGGTPVPVTKIDGVMHTSHRWPQFLPDGKRFLFLACNHKEPGGSKNAIYLGSVDGMAPKMILKSVANAAFADGYLLFTRDRQLFAQQVDEDLALEGEPVPIASDVLYAEGTWRSGFSVAGTGRIAWHSGQSSVISTMQWRDRTGAVIGSFGEPGGYADMDISPDGQKVVFTHGDPQRELWIHDLARNTSTLVPIEGWPDNATWAIDGKAIYVDVLRNGKFELLEKKINGAERLITSREAQLSARSLAPDGKTLYIDGDGPLQAVDLTSANPTITSIVTGNMNARFADVSPDGRWLAYETDENGRTNSFVISRSGAQAKWQISTSGGAMPRWRSDGKELYYVSMAGVMTAVPVENNGSDLQFGRPEPLFTVPLRAGCRAYDVAADGQKFLVNAMTDSESPTIMVLSDWKTRLPK